MKILIADDVEDLVQVLALMVQGIYPDCEIFQAVDGIQAIEAIESHPDLDVVLCDFNMPGKNGGEVFQALRKKQSKIPFVLTSTVRIQDRPEFKNGQNLLALAKPFTEKELENTLRSLEIPSVSRARPKPRFIPIPVPVLLRIGTVDSPLYLKLAEDNFVKVLHPGNRFDQNEFERFSRKETSHLWIESASYDSFILDYKREVLSREAWKELAHVEAAQTLALDHEMILSAGQSLGWSEATVEVALENIKQVIKLLEREPDLKEIARRLTEEKHSRLSALSILLAVACTAILQELGWQAEITRQKMTFASLLHDMELDEDLLATMMTILNEAEISEFTEDPGLKVILEHPMKAAEKLLKWPLCPPDVGTIIRQHHERPDGKGFPNGLEASKISPLAAVMIIAEDMVFHTVDNLGGDPRKYLLGKKEFYSRGEFKAIFDAAIRSLKAP